MGDRISTYSIHRNAVSEFTRLQSDFAKIQQQISSGQKAATFTELGNDLTAVANLQNSITGAAKFVDNNKVVATRLTTMDLALQQMQQVASDLKSNLVIANSSGEVFDIRAFADNALQQVQDNLNVKSNGRSLFAGGKTTQDAVGDLRFVSNILNDEPSANYYQGDDLVFSTQASENLTLDYGVKANDPVFQNLISALHMAAQFGETRNNADYQQADVYLNNALDGLISVRGGVNTDRISLETANAQHNRFSDQLTIVLNDKTGVDIVEATIRSSQTEATLSASLQTFARISKLSLADFLR
jgi:flagellar hook-associated protein 3 FlgL